MSVNKLVTKLLTTLKSSSCVQRIRLSILPLCSLSIFWFPLAGGVGASSSTGGASWEVLPTRWEFSDWFSNIFMKPPGGTGSLSLHDKSIKTKYHRLSWFSQTTSMVLSWLSLTTPYWLHENTSLKKAQVSYCIHGMIWLGLHWQDNKICSCHKLFFNGAAMMV